MLQKILLLGASGMAGHMIYNYLRATNRYDIHTVSYRKKIDEGTIICDVTDKALLSGIIDQHRPDIIINCIGVLIKGAREFPDNAIYINSFLPHFLSRLASGYGGKVIHLSTDCVFRGDKGDYNEDAFKDADDTYGRSKALGELINTADLTIRTSIIGPEIKDNGEGLLEWVIQQKGIINGFKEAYWSGLTTLELAKFIDFAIQNHLKGLVHATNNEKISKFDLIQLIIKFYKLNDIILQAEYGKKVDKSLRNTRTDFSYSFPSYEKMIVAQSSLSI